MNQEAIATHTAGEARAATNDSPRRLFFEKRDDILVFLG
jgi:hypothetical protein